MTTPHGEILVRIKAICDAFECYGYRGAGAALPHQGVVVNNKKRRRLMREYDLQPEQRRRYVVTTHSDHDSPLAAASIEAFGGRYVVRREIQRCWKAAMTYD